MKHGIMGPGKGYTVDDQFFADILHTGVGQSGIGYWAEIVSSTYGENPAHDHAVILVQEEHPDHNPAQYTINLEVIQNGVQRVMQNPPTNQSTSKLIATYYQMWEWLRQSLEDGDTVMVDADVADLVIQYGLFEELRYG